MTTVFLFLEDVVDASGYCSQLITLCLIESNTCSLHVNYKYVKNKNLVKV